MDGDGDGDGVGGGGGLVYNIYLIKYTALCRACMHSFFIDCQSLRELRTTSVLMIAAI
jgi:hypothetical protein